MEAQLSLSGILNTIIKRDNVEVMRGLSGNLLNLIFADPRYNLQIKEEPWRPNQTKIDAVPEQWNKHKGIFNKKGAKK
jgi:DNA modification methylase